jgi:hypothetical protein
MLTLFCGVKAFDVFIEWHYYRKGVAQICATPFEKCIV